MGLSQAMGVAALDDEDVFKFGDFREAFKDMPVAVLRMAFKALRGGKSTERPAAGTGTPQGDERLAELQRQFGYKPKLKDVDTASLLGLYAPDKPNDPISVALKERFGTEPVVAFDDDGKVNVAATVEYASGIEQGFPKTDTVNVNGRLVKLWPVGIKPDVMVEEDPLFPGNPLRNGVSVTNHRNWSKVTQPDRQFCRLVLEQGAIDPSNHEAVLRLLERAQDGDGAKAAPNRKLEDAYPEIGLLWREKCKRDELPKLKIELGKAAKPQNPFGVKRNY